MIFYLVTLTYFKKKLSWTMTFESEGLLIVAIYIWLPPASYVVFSDNSSYRFLYSKELYLHLFGVISMFLRGRMLISKI